MRLTYFTLFFAAIGNIATFLPWVYYPKGNTNLYGYVGDGLITGFLFVLVTVFSFYELYKKRDLQLNKIISGIIGLLMLILAVNNIFEIEYQKSNFETDNPFIGAAFAGFTQGIGLYVLGIGGLGVFLFSLFGYLKCRSNKETTQSKKLNIVIPLSIIVLVIGIFLRDKIFTGSAPSEEALSAIFKKDVEAMGKCLITGDYDCFIDYNHPMIVQSYGSKSEMKHLLNEAMRTFRDNVGDYSKIQFQDVEQVERKGKNIQAVVNQDVTIVKEMNESIEHQKVLAVSEDGGHSWHYINLSGMDRSRIEKYYPALNPNIKI